MVAELPLRPRTALLALPLLLLAGCYASNVVAVADRRVVESVEPTNWRRAGSADLLGYHRSLRITGPCAASLRKLCYWFDADGRYSGAALVAGDGDTAFQTLGGTWLLNGEGLVLDGAPAVTVEAVDDLLRLTTDQGVLVLVRETAQ